MTDAIANPPQNTAKPIQKRPTHRISDLCGLLETYMPKDQIREVYRAYLYSAEAHNGQYRKSGESYVFHPIAVAYILADMFLDHKCIMAALLHDVIEDTDIGKLEITQVFDAEIAELVDGVTKLTQANFKNRVEAQAANMDKVLLAMTQDIRVILIKLADRLHNMRTLGYMEPQKMRRIAKETLDIYGPIANRLGLNSIYLELEDLGFKHYWPWRYKCLNNTVEKLHQKRTRFIQIVEQAVRERLHKEGIKGRVIGRQKHLYSIYHKMKTKRRPFSEVVDVYALRVVVDRLDTCYRTLGVVHSLYKPVPGRFKDYIALPKANSYQSLHTLLIGPNGVRVEMQIRTEDMHRSAESGIAAHWIYKTSTEHNSKIHTHAPKDWLNNLLEIKQGSKDPVEFLENVKIDLFPDEVYVFTPKGSIIVLPQGATVVDFAYTIHSDVGNTCIGARVDHHLVPLRTQLHSGQTIEIFTNPLARPQPNWLNFVVTGHARARLRACLKQQAAQEASELGRSILNTELKALNVTWEQITEQRLQSLLTHMQLATVTELWRQIGLGNIWAWLVARRLTANDAKEFLDIPATSGKHGRLVIKGCGSLVVNFAKCCHPIVGDRIIGKFNPGSGLVIHRQGCRNLGDLRRLRQNWLEMEWEPGIEMELPTKIQVGVDNKLGALATVATVISNAGCNIEAANLTDQDGSGALNFLVTVQGRKHLARVIRNLRALSSVTHVASR